MRFTKAHVALSEAMKAVIGLYYSCTPTPADAKSSKDGTATALDRLFSSLSHVGIEVDFDPTAMRGKFPKASVVVTDVSLKTVTAFMKALYKAIELEDYLHFLLERVEHRVETVLHADDEAIEEYIHDKVYKQIEAEFKVDGRLPWESKEEVEIDEDRNIVWTENPVPVQTTPEIAAKKAEYQERMKEADIKAHNFTSLPDVVIPEAVIRRSVTRAINKGPIDRRSVDFVDIYTVNYRSVSVNPAPGSKFARKLLFTKPKELPPTVVPSLEFPHWSSFVQFVRAVLVGFHVVFGSYDRLKICPVCRRMSFEKRKGQRQFCSDVCRRLHFKSVLEPQEKVRCRNKHNARLDRSGKKDRVGKTQCEDCDQYTLSSKEQSCPALRTKQSTIEEKQT